MKKLKYAEKVHDFGDFFTEVSMRNLSKKLVSLGTCIAICSTTILAGGCSSSKNSSTSNGGKIDMKALEKEEKELKPDYTVKYDRA